MDFLKYKKIYFLISFVVVSLGIFSIFAFGFKFGVDFVGGSDLEYKFSKEVSSEEILGKLRERGIDVKSAKKTQNGYLFKFSPLEIEKKEEVKETLHAIDDKAEELRYEVVGASFGPELIKKTIYALIVASGVILIWIAVQFKSVKFGTSAVFAMLHDTLVLVGLYTLFGELWGAEIDFLFVTAVLTTLSFSVHDTIVVYDRIREKQKKEGGEMNDIANQAINETMVRSLNNSFTIIFMLVAFILFGGETIRWFVVALLIGTISGTYSSPFVAVPVLVVWDELANKIKNRL